MFRDTEPGSRVTQCLVGPAYEHVMESSRSERTWRDQRSTAIDYVYKYELVTLDTSLEAVVLMVNCDSLLSSFDDDVTQPMIVSPFGRFWCCPLVCGTLL